jgi:CheY-like chemotaxis protein/signal transduction histidine kinase/HAMP domain-containing protein
MFKNLNIRAKLSVLILLMLLPLIYFVFTSVTQEANEVSKLKQVHNRLLETDRLSVLINDIQRERALSQMFVSSAGINFSRRLQTQRKRTDNSINELIQYYNQQDTGLGDLNILNQLDIHRKEVDLLKGGSARYDAFFLSVIDKVVSRIEISNAYIEDPQIRRQLLGYINLINAKQRLGQLRTLLSGVLSRNRISNEEYAELHIYNSFFDQSLENFQRNVSPQIREFYADKTGADVIRRSNELLNLLKEPNNFQFQNYDALQWYDNFTAYTDLLREVEVYLLNQTSEELKEQIALRDSLFWIYIGVVAGIVAVALIYAVYFLNTVSSSLYQLKSAADKVALGETDIKLTINSGDEIGTLANSFKAVVGKNIYLSEVTDAIGRGDYNQQLILASEYDMLGNAISKMQDNLRELSNENERRNWLLTGNTRLDDAMRGVKTLEKLCYNSVESIAKYVNANLGAIYLLSEQSSLLEMVSGYAYNVEDAAKKEFNIGEGLIGQAAASNEMIVVDNVKEEYLRIRSGLVDINPASVVFLPLSYNDELVGAIEIAKKDQFEPSHLEFLDSIKEKIAMVIISLKADLKTAELLYETQNQAEELETQQEELRQINDELREQSIRLQASEEELKTNQEELMEKNAELEEKANQLEEQYEAIRVKNKQLEEAREAIDIKINQVETISKYKSEFLANMSHELRTPLNSILILAKLVEENKEKNLTPKQIEFASVIHNSGSDLLKLINEILDLAKIESGKISLDIKEVPLKELDVKNQFVQLAKEKRLKFDVSYEEGLPVTMETDTFRLQQILRNLLSNAFKFTSEGGSVEMNVAVASDKVKFSNEKLRKAHTVIAFGIKDTGIGIPEEKQHIVFEAFQQADTSTTRRFGGTGLGLSISRELAQLLGGEIQLESQENVGSKFTLYLPQYLQAQEQRSAVEKESVQLPTQLQENIIAAAAPVSFLDQQEKQSQKERLILIVEDDKGFSKILADFSRDRNFKVLTTSSGREGIRLAQENLPDAILLDIQLPDISGWDVLEYIKKDRNTQHIPVHVMSAYDSDVLQKGISSDNYLPKPVTLEILDKAFYKIQSQSSKPVQKILIVEDNAIENKAIAELLLAHDIHSDSAHSATDALQMLSSKIYDCIILDINLPDMVGFDLLEKIKQDKGMADTPVVIYSGKDLTEAEEFRLKKHANTIIIKTLYSYSRLLEEVKLFLHKVKERIPLEKEKKIKLHRSEEVLKGKKVLVVDDDSRNIYSLYNVFEGQDMEIVVANDGQEALDKLDEHPDVGIVLMDIMMPVMDGMECMRLIRKKPEFNKLPIIALTAKAMKGDREKSIEAGASDYISKPVDVEKLLSLMRVWLYGSGNGVA